MTRLLALADGQDNPHGGTRAVLVLDSDGAVVAQNDFPGDRESQAGAAAFAGAGLIYPVEAVKDAFAVLAWDADAGVGNFNPDVFSADTGINGDRAAV